MQMFEPKKILTNTKSMKYSFYVLHSESKSMDYFTCFFHTEKFYSDENKALFFDIFDKNLLFWQVYLIFIDYNDNNNLYSLMYSKI